MEQPKRDLPEQPPRMRKLPVDERGFPVPKFVEWIDGKPDFRVMNADHYRDALKRDLCWICGEKLGVNKVFVIGPMCCINRISAEPPSHRDCALFAARACPFLSRPLAHRRTRDQPDQHRKPAGIMLERNPGVTCLWTTRTYRVEAAPGGVLLRIGPPESVEFFAHGRDATSAEIDRSVETGLPVLERLARQDGPEGLAEFARSLARWNATRMRLAAA
jgi:hypothetical protein